VWQRKENPTAKRASDRVLNRQLQRLAKRWTRLLARNLPIGAAQHRALLHQEILAYIRCLIELKTNARPSGLRRVKQRLAALPPPLPTRQSPSTRAEGGGWRASTGVKPVQPISQPLADALAFLPAKAAKPEGDFTLTPAAMQRFCRLTGMDPTKFAGTGEAQAGLVFYVVAFALLSDLDHTSDLEMTLTLKRLRVCREELSQAVARILTGVATRKQYSLHELRSSLTRTLGLPPSEI